MNILSNLNIILIFISITSIYSKESSMITVPLKVIHNGFEKYPLPNVTKITIEKEVEVQTIFGPKVRKLKEEISGNITKLKCELFAAEIIIAKTQKFNVILDTGSVDLWVPGEGSNDTYEIEHHYKPSNTSKKLNDKFSIQYGTGKTEGNYYTDFISFITKDRHDIKFGVADKTNFEVEGADGIMGLAKRYTLDQYSKIWTMYNKNIISSKSFSFKYFPQDYVEMYLGDEHPDFDNNTNPNNTGDCQLLNQGVYDKLLWTCRLYDFGLVSEDNKKNVSYSYKKSFLFDTGSNTMMLPLEILTGLQAELSKFNCYVTTLDQYGDDVKLIACKDKNIVPNVFIEVGDNYLILDKDLMFFEYDEGLYILNVQFQDKMDIALIGQPFFRMFHTRFDYEKKKLKFYTEDESKIRFASHKEEEKEIDYEKIVIAVVVVFAFALAICFVLKCLRKTFCSSSKKVTKK